MVELLESYSNLSDQGELVRAVLEIVPSGQSGPNSGVPRRIRRTLDPAELEDLAEAYKAGTSIKDLAELLETNRSTILKHLQRLDIPRRYPALDSDQCDEVCRLYQSGLNSSEIAPLFEVSTDTVLRALHRSGIDTRTR
jgi:DNA-binding CsgD family transcriptional regulator